MRRLKRRFDLCPALSNLPASGVAFTERMIAGISELMSKRVSPPSAHDVARLAGVSQAAVSRAFTPGASIATATRDKVLEAADVLGYRPNLLARSLIKGRSGIIGVVIADPSYPFFQAALDELSSRLSKAGKHILIFTSKGLASADVHVEDLLRYRVDALLLMAARVSPSLEVRCRDQGIPIIAFSRPPPESRYVGSITADNVRGGAAIARHLLQQGYRRIAFMAGLPESTSSLEREAGFTQGLAAGGVAAAGRVVGDFVRPTAISAARELLARAPRPDALFCANDVMAIAAIEVARFEFGLEIGRDLGVAGFDDIEQAAWPSFDLTTFTLPVEALMARVTEVLLDGGFLHPVDLIVAGELKARGSTRRE